jgi:hypothetical protein
MQQEQQIDQLKRAMEEAEMKNKEESDRRVTAERKRLEEAHLSKEEIEKQLAFKSAAR